MADTYWGVDSASSTTSKVGVKGHPTLFEFVTDKMGQMPDFWGRYVGGSFGLTKEEASYIHTKSDGQTRILVVYNGAHNSKASVGGGFAAGQKDALKAIARAKKVGVPADVWIYGDIEPGWHCAADWFRGWWDTMRQSQYGGMGGIYENPLKWNAKNFSDPYTKAYKGDSPFIFQDSPGLGRYLWSQQPQKAKKGPGEIDFGFAPAEPPGMAGMTVLWQYAIDCKLGTKHGLIDMNLADQRGYNSMWARESGQGVLV